MAAQDGDDLHAGPDDAWHALEVDQTGARLETSPQGLSADEAARRLTRYGPNTLARQGGAGSLTRFLRQFHNLLIYLLLVAAAGTAWLQHWIDTGVILGVVLINALIGFLQEGKAEQALNALRGMLSPKAVVVRDDQRGTVDAAELVPGDLVLVESGDRVPADLRLFEAHGVLIDEAVLTGESVATAKDTDPVESETELGDRDCMAFSGTLVTQGQARGWVVATGQQTQIGRVSRMLAEVTTLQTPLLRQVAQFSRWLSGAIVVAALGTFLLGYFLRGYAAHEMFLAAVSLAVAAIPEGLPAIMTITLAIGVQRMAQRNAIIRRLPAVETLGSVTVICSDKTGTLTRNEMTVQSLVSAADSWQVEGVGYRPEGRFLRDDAEVSAEEAPLLRELLAMAMLCNDAHVASNDAGNWFCDGDPTEGGLLVAGLKAGMEPQVLADAHPRLHAIPFESASKFMATLYEMPDGPPLLIMKGAPEAVLQACDRQRSADGETAPLDADFWDQQIEALASQGQRVLALAVAEQDAGSSRLDADSVAGGLVLLGLFGMIDPPREEAIDAVAQCHEAGIGVKMITGDHALTAAAIAARLGIGDGSRVVTGREVESLDDAALQEQVRTVDVFARAAPEHKLRLVQALQARHQVVAMTGDGVNDAPALKRADVGVAMGIKGSEAAREASEMVLADDNFASIAAAVEQGRTVYDNLTKAILFILPTNGGQALTIAAAVLLGLTLPLTPVQVLWVNMVVAVTLALALAFEPGEPGLMSRRPRTPDTPLLTGLLLWRVGFVSLLLVAGTFGHFLWLQTAGAAIEVARTAAINTLVAGTLAYLFNSRYILEPVLNRDGLLGSRIVWLTVATLVVLQLLFTYAPPLQLLFGTAGLDLVHWGVVLAFGLLVLLLVEAEKVVLRRRRAADRDTPRQ